MGMRVGVHLSSHHCRTKHYSHVGGQHLVHTSFLNDSVSIKEKEYKLQGEVNNMDYAGKEGRLCRLNLYIHMIIAVSEASPTVMMTFHPHMQIV